MNIDNLNSNPLLSLSGSPESIQQGLQTEGLNPVDFSTTLLEKIGQLESAEGNLNLTTANELQEFVGLLGNFLPAGKQLAKEIDLEDILSGITDAAIALEDMEIESSQLEMKLAELVEELETMKAGIPDQTALKEKIEQIREAILKVQVQEESEKNLGNEIVLNNEVSEEKPERDDQKASLISARLVKKESIDDEQNLETSVLDTSTDLDKRIDLLASEIQAIKDSLSEKSIVRNGSEREMRQIDADNKMNGLPLANQSTALTNELDGTKKSEGIAAAVSAQDINPNFKKDLLLKSGVEDKSFVTSTKAGAETFAQQENAFGKSDQDKPFFSNKQNGMIENLNLKEMDLGSEKTLPRFATDIAMLNRAVVTESKVEVPPMTKPFSHPEWNKEMGERVIWMHKQAIPSAELRLNPEHLGPIKIRIDLTQDQATVAFTAQHAVVKEAIEASLPKLRELFSAQQLNLVDVNVSQNDSGQKQSKGFEQMGSGAGNENSKNENEIITNENAENTMEIMDEIEAGRAIASNGVLSIFA